MNKEELLKMLHDSGLADEEIKALLGEIMHDLEGAVNPEDEAKKQEEAEAEKKEASRLLGVEL